MEEQENWRPAAGDEGASDEAEDEEGVEDQTVEAEAAGSSGSGAPKARVQEAAWGKGTDRQDFGALKIGWRPSVGAQSVGLQAAGTQSAGGQTAGNGDDDTGSQPNGANQGPAPDWRSWISRFFTNLYPN